MFDLLIHEMGIIVLFILMAINGSIGIVPSEAVLFMGGVYAYASNYNLIHTLSSSVFGNLIGAFILYFIGRSFGYNWLIKIKYVGKFITKKELDDIAKKFRIDGAHWVGIFRCIPMVRSIVSIPAGMIKMPFWIFFFYSTIGIIIWSILWQSLGYFLGISFIWLNDYIIWAMIILTILTFFLIKKHKKGCG